MFLFLQRRRQPVALTPILHPLLHSLLYPLLHPLLHPLLLRLLHPLLHPLLHLLLLRLLHLMLALCVCRCVCVCLLRLRLVQAALAETDVLELLLPELQHSPFAVRLVAELCLDNKDAGDKIPDSEVRAAGSG